MSALAALSAAEEFATQPPTNAAIDALYAAGDFTTLFAEDRSLRPQRRLRVAY